MNNIQSDTDVILMALQKERDELHDRIMQVNGIIKRVKSLEYSASNEVVEPKQIDNQQPIEKPLNIFPKTADIKVLIIRAFDVISVACKQKTVQSVYNELSGNQYSVRESMRTLNKNKVLVRILHKATGKGFM